MRTLKPRHKYKRTTTKCKGERIYVKFEEQYEKNSNEKSAITILNSTFTPSKYKITDDFYTYINYGWIHDMSKQIAKTPKHYVQVDSVRITQEDVYYELINIVKQYVKNNNTKLSKSIKNVYESLYNLDMQSSEQYFEDYRKYIEKQVASGDLYDILSNQNRNEIISSGTPIVWNVSIDDKNSKIYKSYISPPALTLYDLALYSENKKSNSKYKKDVKNHYIEYVNSMFKLCLGQDHKHNPEDVWVCECVIAKALNYDAGLDVYNVINKQNSVKEYGFDWVLFTKKLGYVKAPSTFVCSNLSYLKKIMIILETEWREPKWVTYFLYNCFRQAIRFHTTGKLIHYSFHDKFIAGVQIPYPREIYPIFGLSMCFNTFLSNEYTALHTNDTIINYVEDLTVDLLTVFKRVISRNTWLAASTKSRALLKLDKIKLLVGSPKLLREDPILNYDSKDAFQNMIKISSWRTDKYIEMDGLSNKLDVPIIDWNHMTMTGKQSYNVNAYYMANENTIYIPCAYLQQPFIDLNERGIEYNLANIGYTLTHEMSHCLDDFGSQYDENGNLYDWWTPADKKQFKSRVGNIIKQYETFAGYDGVKMDASLSVGENIADISGLAICEEYLQDVHNKNNYTVPLRSLSFQTFFVYNAIQSRQKIEDIAFKAQLKVNPHPMEKYRVNCPLSRLKLFKNIYNIKKGDKMYWGNDQPFW